MFANRPDPNTPMEGRGAPGPPHPGSSRVSQGYLPYQQGTQEPSLCGLARAPRLPRPAPPCSGPATPSWAVGYFAARYSCRFQLSEVWGSLLLRAEQGYPITQKTIGCTVEVVCVARPPRPSPSPATAPLTSVCSAAPGLGHVSSVRDALTTPRDVALPHTPCQAPALCSHHRKFRSL